MRRNVSDDGDVFKEIKKVVNAFQQRKAWVCHSN